ncbi:putative translocation protein (Sec66) [Penicillium brasilianum]|uniref:Putative translocation protein (Sec66) n=1 Tax=Penicillium brasilianum TaxID=104259 RepID=A0A1S9RGD4_PENBI|nr:putative translocation protein (Sec66) [Penicillium brasilianum]
MVDWLSLAVPLAYLGVLIGSLATFSSLYRKRKAQKAASLEAWFPAHLQRDIYFSLMHLDPSSQSEKKTPAVPESVLKASLLRRATEDIRRVMTLRSQKQALSMLLQRGSVGDDLWQRFLRAEKEMEDEVRDVVAEANAYVPGWGQVIFQSANEMLNNDLYRVRVAEHQEKVKEEREWWDKKKSSIQEGFMKELNEEEKEKEGGLKSTAQLPATPAKSGESEPVTVAAASVQGSDDDAVLVEAHPSVKSPGSPSGGGKKKKGKGKK